MASWQYREKAAPQDRYPISEPQLVRSLVSGALDDHHEFATVDSENWWQAWQTVAQLAGAGSLPLTIPPDQRWRINEAEEVSAGTLRMLMSSPEFSGGTTLTQLATGRKYSPLQTLLSWVPTTTGKRNRRPKLSTTAPPVRSKSQQTRTESVPEKRKETAPEKQKESPSVQSVVKPESRLTAATAQSQELNLQRQKIAKRRAASATSSRLPAPVPKPRDRSHRGLSLDDEDELEMTSMIDMTFLLLIFFMVTSTITAISAVQLPKAVAGRAERTEERVVVLMDLPVDLRDTKAAGFQGGAATSLKDAVLTIVGGSGEPIGADQLATALAAEFERTPGAGFILQANRRMPVGAVREALKIAMDAGASEAMVGVSMPK